MPPQQCDASSSQLYISLNCLIRQEARNYRLLKPKREPLKCTFTPSEDKCRGVSVAWLVTFLFVAHEPQIAKISEEVIGLAHQWRSQCEALWALLTKSLYMRTVNYYVVNTHYRPACFKSIDCRVEITVRRKTIWPPSKETNTILSSGPRAHTLSFWHTCTLIVSLKIMVMYDWYSAKICTW